MSGRERLHFLRAQRGFQFPSEIDMSISRLAFGVSSLHILSTSPTNKDRAFEDKGGIEVIETTSPFSMKWGMRTKGRWHAASTLLPTCCLTVP